jgi:peptidyl-prolyl cis-trans isomerase B (cyclophilin B)
MKKIIASVPLAFLIIGCSGPTTESTDANSVIVSSAQANTATVPTSNNGSADLDGANSAGNSKTAPVAANSAPAKPAVKSYTGPADPRYKVADESAGMPQQMAEAAKAAKVPPPPKDMKVPDKARVQLNTSQGPIVVELNGKAAPLHVKSFLYLTKIKYFDGTKFHRYVPGFVIQGGSAFSKMNVPEEMVGAGSPGYTIPREHNKLTHGDMVFAAARGGDPDSAGSQFYITLGPQPNLDEGDGYTVFGKVVSGQANAMKLKQNDALKSVIVLK